MKYGILDTGDSSGDDHTSWRGAILRARKKVYSASGSLTLLPALALFLTPVLGNVIGQRHGRQHTDSTDKHTDTITPVTFLFITLYLNPGRVVKTTGLQRQHQSTESQCRGGGARAEKYTAPILRHGHGHFPLLRQMCTMRFDKNRCSGRKGGSGRGWAILALQLRRRLLHLRKSTPYSQTATIPVPLGPGQAGGPPCWGRRCGPLNR